MSTLVLPDAPRPKPRPGPMYTTSGPTRYISIAANLLPDELIASRRLARLKRRVLLGLVVLLALLVAWYAFSVWSTSKAKSDLAAAQQQTTVLQNKQRTYQPLVQAQAQAQAITNTLTKLMTGDVQWKNMLAVLRKSATHGVQVTSISASMTSGATGAGQATGGLGVLNQTGKQAVGTLTLTGTAPDKSAVAAYVDTLSKVKGLAAPFPASVSAGGTGGAYTYSVSVLITSDALGGRYAPTPAGGN